MRNETRALEAALHSEQTCSSTKLRARHFITSNFSGNFISFLKIFVVFVCFLNTFYS